MIEPTNGLIEIASNAKIPLTFFVDIGYLLSLEKFMTGFPELKNDHKKVTEQLAELVSKGHDLQLHIHPHWERSTYENGRWTCNTNGAYRLADFSDDEITSVFKRYKSKLDSFRPTPCRAFRAGGWCIQPFNRLKSIFEELELKIDSSVFPGGHFDGGNYEFDFRNAPNKPVYRFDDDVCVEKDDGPFSEYPIASFRYSPLFYWKLYVLGRLFPNEHKMIGDGQFMSQPGRKKAVLTRWTCNHVSTDGYYASRLDQIAAYYASKNWSHLVTIGHPKSMTKYSFRKLRAFIAKQGKNYSFLTFNDLP